MERVKEEYCEIMLTPSPGGQPPAEVGVAGGAAALLYLGGVGVAGGAALLQLLRHALQLEPRPWHELLQELPPAAEPQVDGAAGHPPAQHTPSPCKI